MSDLHIRCATLADIDTALLFWRDAAEGTSISDDHDGVGRLIRRDPEALLLAERDGLLTGTVMAGFDGWRCSAYRLDSPYTPPTVGRASPPPRWKQ